MLTKANNSLTYESCTTRPYSMKSRGNKIVLKTSDLHQCKLNSQPKQKNGQAGLQSINHCEKDQQ